MNEEKEIRFIDLFGGIGGVSLAFNRASEGWSNPHTNIRGPATETGDTEGQHSKPDNNRPKRLFNCVGYYEIDKYAVQTYNKNFRTKHKPVDVTTLDPEEIPDHEILCAGFPCQAFSIAGKRQGFKDTRGTLFFEICRILEAKRPEMVLLENVKGLLSHDRYRTFRIILESLRELGFLGGYQLLNTKDFGLPQNRERVFIVGYLREKCRREVLPITECDREFIRVEQASRRGGSRMEDEVASTIRGGNKWLDSMISSSIDANYWKGGRAGRSMIIHNIYGGFNEDKPRIFEDYSPTIRTPKGGGHIPAVMNTLTEATGNRAVSSSEFLRSVNDVKESIGQVRRLTPVECARLQGFPDTWCNSVSDTQAYRQLGNAISVPVVEAIGRKILQVWDGPIDEGYEKIKINKSLF